MIKERIKKYLDSQGITKYKFYKDLGFANGFLDKSKVIGTDKYSKITSFYTNINANWLLTGEGDMLKTPEIEKRGEGKVAEPTIDVQSIPFYDVKASAGILSLFNGDRLNIPMESISIPNMPKCDGALTVTGDSMYPLIKSGDIVFYKVVQDLKNSIYYGNMYLVVVDLEGDILVLIKYVHKGKSETKLKLVSENRHHEDVEIDIDKIKALALIKGNVRFNFMG